MNRLVILSALLLSILAVVKCCPHGSETNEFLQAGTFEVPIDHFRPRDNRTFTYTYCSNTQHYQSGGPVFVFIGDGYDHSTQWIEQGLMVDLARELHAVLVHADHRYFGENIPTETASLEDLQHFSVENSLSDIAYLVTAVKADLNAADARAIVYGSGIGAKLAVWARQKFPHIIHGAWSSSGLFQADPISPSYYNLLSWNIHTISAQCEYRVEELFQTMHSMILNNETAELQEALNLCNPVDASSPSDIAAFIEANIYYISKFIDDNHLSGLQSFCRDINVYPDEVVRSYARWLLFIYGINSNCFDLSYASLVESARTESWNETGTLTGVRQYRYAQCTQLGYMKVTSPNGIFPNVVTADYQYGICEDIFGEGYDRLTIQQASRALDIQYGSRNQQASHVVYTNGMLDPWIDHAITDNNIQNSQVINMNYLSASGDLESIAGWQSAEVRQTKETIMTLITQWVLGYSTIPFATDYVALNA